MLQQCLPFTVLKHMQESSSWILDIILLQQCLPFTVLKQFAERSAKRFNMSALQQYLPFTVLKRALVVWLNFITISCNSAYRLRY